MCMQQRPPPRWCRRACPEVRPTRAHTHLRAHMRTCMHTHVHTHTCAHARIHACWRRYQIRLYDKQAKQYKDIIVDDRCGVRGASGRVRERGSTGRLVLCWRTRLPTCSGSRDEQCNRTQSGAKPTWIRRHVMLRPVHSEANACLPHTHPTPPATTPMPGPFSPFLSPSRPMHTVLSLC